MNKEKNKYELIKGEKKYIFETNIKDNLIHLSLKTPTGKIVSHYLSIENLKILDNLFNSIQSEKQGLERIDKILKEHKVAVIEENQNLKIVFYIKNEDELNKIEIYFGDEKPKSIVDIQAVLGNNTKENININSNTNFDNLKTNFKQKDIIDTKQLIKGTNNTNIYTNNTNNINTSTPMITLPTKYLPTEIIEIESKEEQTFNNNIDNIPSPQENTIQDNSNENINYNIEQSSININNTLTKYNEISSLIVELNKLKYEEIKSIKKSLDEMQNYEKQKQEEKDNLILRKQIEEIERLNNEYASQLNELRKTKTQTPKKIQQGLDSKNITFEEKSQKVCVKGELIHSPLELELITRKISSNSFSNKKLSLNLIYKASVDTDKASAFHKKCDKAKSTLVLIETNKGKRFGGYTSTDWEGNCIEKKDEKAFIFSLDKMKIYENIQGEDAIGCYPKFGPIFMGCQIRINDNAFSKGGSTFEKGMNFNTEEDYELNGGERLFNIKDIEVYEVIIH